MSTRNHAETLLWALSRLSGDMCVSLYDSGFHGITGTYNRNSVEAPSKTRFCATLHRLCPDSYEICLASDLHARKKCRESGELYRYRCPFGLFEAILPLTHGNETVGYVMIGQSLPAGDEAEQFLRSSVSVLNGDPAAVLGLTDCLPRHSPEEYDAVCTILSGLAEQLAELQKNEKAQEELAVLVDQYLHRHYDKPLTLRHLSIHFHCSTVTLTEHFRKAYGKTIIGTLAEIRLKNAKELLVKTNRPVGEIARLCGFLDMGYFSKIFRKHTGLSPTDFRLRGASDLF